MIKNRWNTNTDEWINERHYTKDEVDKKLDEILTNTVPATSIPVTITYLDGTTQSVDLYARG